MLVLESVLPDIVLHRQRNLPSVMAGLDDGFNEVFENILNFRDVGKTVNEFLGEKYAKFCPGRKLFCLPSRWLTESIDV